MRAARPSLVIASIRSAAPLATSAIVRPAAAPVRLDAASAHLQSERAYDRKLSTMLTDRLERIVGDGNVVVVSNVELGRGRRAGTVVRMRISVVVDSAATSAQAAAAKNTVQAIMGGNRADSFAFTTARLAGSSTQAGADHVDVAGRLVDQRLLVALLTSLVVLVVGGTVMLVRDHKQASSRRELVPVPEPASFSSYAA
jgi:hypothetical protein